MGRGSAPHPPGLYRPDNKYDELKATLRNDIVEKFKEILKEEINKINDKLEGKIHQLCQDKSFHQEQINKNRIELLQLLLKKQSSTIEDFV